jgi:amino acid permease
MNWICTIYAALLFFVLTPGILVTLPPKSSKLVVAGFHAVVFALVYHFTHKIVWRMSSGREGMEVEMEKEKKKNN